MNPPPFQKATSPRSSFELTPESIADCLNSFGYEKLHRNDGYQTILYVVKGIFELKDSWETSPETAVLKIEELLRSIGGVFLVNLNVEAVLYDVISYKMPGQYMTTL